MCIGVNGGFFAGGRQRPRVVDLAAFHGMRIGVYTLLGVSGAMLGRVVVQSGIIGKAQGLLMILAGGLIVLLGLNLGGWIGRRARAPQGAITVPFLAALPAKRAHLPPLVAGLCNGLVPCGLVSLVAIKGAATADPFQAGLMMLAFGLGTLPTLVALSLLGSVAGFRADGTTARVLGIAVVAAGFWTLYQGYVVYDVIRGLANW
jgi:sulfite exporter TauE/SafE